MKQVTTILFVVLGVLFGKRESSFAQSPIEQPWKFWKYVDVKGLDAWGDSNDGSKDIVALYVRESADSLYFRVDMFDLRQDAEVNLFLALDYKSGGTTRLLQGNSTLTADISWDILLRVTSTGTRAAFDETFIDHPEFVSSVAFDNSLDFIQFAVPRQALTGWSNQPFTVQAFTLNDGSTSILDKTAAIRTNATTGRAKVLLIFENTFGGGGATPTFIDMYDGYSLNGWERPGELRGIRYLMDAAERYHLPVTLSDLRIDALPPNEYFGINDRLRDMESRGLIEMPIKATYGYFMPWQAKEVNSLMLRLAREYREKFGFRTQRVFYPYEGRVTMANIRSIKDAGYEAVWATDNFGYSVGWGDGWITDPAVRDRIESGKKIHIFNGMKFFFDTRNGNDQGIRYDSRWEPLTWLGEDHILFAGTDRGLHFWWRRILLDLALDEDQEKFFTLAADILLTPMIFPDVSDRTLRWLASHPWIEVTTMEDLLTRNWKPIDHGILPLADDDPLQRFKRQGDYHYNAHFWDHYYGAISDGHTEFIPKGTAIEAYFDYVPYLRDGQRIPSGKKMGDYKTPGTIVYQTVQNLLSAPENALTRLAWLSYFMKVGEQTLHADADYQSGADASSIRGPYLHPVAKNRANHLAQVNKIVAAARWADEVAKGQHTGSPQVLVEDLDLDGENEFVLMNDRIFATFENDGGRMDHAFLYDPTLGPIQMAAPYWQFNLDWYTTFAYGEMPRPDASFEVPFEDNWNGYHHLVYSSSSTDSTITFTSPDGKIKKTFTLVDNTVRATYQLVSPEWTLVGLNLSVDMAAMFTPNWWQRISKIQTGETAGWKSMFGGMGTVSLTGLGLDQMISFTDSPVRAEQRARADGSSYPPGHFEPFPYSKVVVNNQGSTQFTVSLVLSADGANSPVLQTGTKRLSFGPVPLNQSREVAVVITNAGNDTLRITDVVSSRPTFSVYPTSLLIPHRESARYTVRFSPVTLGLDSAIVLFFSNSVSSPDTIVVTGVGATVSSAVIAVEVPREFSLSQNFPNPFNPTTTIRFSVEQSGRALLRVYDILGREVRTLYDGEARAGSMHQVVFDAAGLTSGVYFVRLESSGSVTTRKVLLAR